MSKDIVQKITSVRVTRVRIFNIIPEITILSTLEVSLCNY